MDSSKMILELVQPPEMSPMAFIDFKIIPFSTICQLIPVYSCKAKKKPASCYCKNILKPMT